MYPLNQPHLSLLTSSVPLVSEGPLFKLSPSNGTAAKIDRLRSAEKLQVRSTSVIQLRGYGL